VTDYCDNFAECTQIITVDDTTDPVITCPAAVSVQCPEDVPPPATDSTEFVAQGGSFSDNCDPSPDFTYVGDSPLTDSCGGTITRTYRATDYCDNFAECTQIITVNDTIPPEITCPPDVTLQLGESTHPDNTGYATATDNCDPDPDISWSDERIDSTIIRTWIAVDYCENADTCHQKIGTIHRICVCMDSTSVMPGYHAKIHLVWTDVPEMGGFDFLVCYDQSGLYFLGATPLGVIADWEYFTYRHSWQDNCGGGCPSGYIRLIGIADMYDSHYPGDHVFNPADGPFVELVFQTSQDFNFIGQAFHLNYCWLECGDNTVSSMSGDSLYMAVDIKEKLPDEDCLAGDKGYTPEPVIKFCHGIICIVPPEDARGDINLNGVANEIADAVLFANSFIYGWEVLGYPNDDYWENRKLATDVNNDGVPLTVADLVYLIRVITGDANPFPESGEGGGAKLSPLSISGSVARIEHGDEVMSVHIISPVDLGAIAFTINVEGLEIGTATGTERSGEMTVKSGVKDGTLRVLVYSMLAKSIPAGSGAVIEIPVSGEGSVELTAVDASDRVGRTLEFELGRTPPIPEVYELLQNYPNPFNAGTVIRFRLPESSAWNLKIYDIVGRVVHEFGGQSEPGEIMVRWDGKDAGGKAVSSGMYFYRMKAASFTQTRKMVLVK